MIRLAVVLLAATLAAGPACAQSGDGVWPNRPVHFVVPFAAGGSTAMVSQGVDSETSTPEALTGRVRDELGNGERSSTRPVSSRNDWPFRN